MSIFRLAFFLFVSIALSACSIFTTKPAQDLSLLSWKAKHAKILSLHTWSLRGRMIAANNDDKQALNIYWKQVNDNYRIQLSGPIGFGRVILTGDKNSVSVTSSDDEKTFASIQQAQAYYKLPPIPIEQLRYWALGIPSPLSNTAQEKFNSQGELTQFTQDQWIININEHSASMLTPSQIHITRTLNSRKIAVTLKVASWDIPSLSTQSLNTQSSTIVAL